MNHMIVMIGKDGSVMTSQDEKMYYGIDSKPDYYFQKDIYGSGWFAKQDIPYHPGKKLDWQLSEMAATGTIIMLDTTSKDKDGNLNKGLQMVTPSLDMITDSQKEVLASMYQQLCDSDLKQVMIDCIKDEKMLIIDDSFYNLDEFYEKAAISGYKEIRRQK